MKNKEIDVKDVFYSAEYKKKAEEINNTEVDATNILDPNFEEKKEELDKTIIKTAEEYKKNKPLRDAMLTNSHICNGEVCPNEDFLNFLKEQEKLKKTKRKRI